MCYDTSFILRPSHTEEVGEKTCIYNDTRALLHYNIYLPVGCGDPMPPLCAIILVSHSDLPTQKSCIGRHACEATTAQLHSNSISVGCGDPMPPRSGTLECYNSTEEGSKVFYRCNAGLTPQEQMISVCASNGSWAPDPIELQCSQLPPGISKQVH